jgi:hypothetical protein
MNYDFQLDLDEVTLHALDRDILWLSEYLEIPATLLAFSLECVGEGLRKGIVSVGGHEREITHFAHMCRVAFFMKWFFPRDTFGRFLASIHDVKEEALPGRENRWEEASEVAGVDGLSDAVYMITEREIPECEITDNSIPKGFDVAYIIKYRSFLVNLREVWEFVGNVELCDRLDASSNFWYLNNPKYMARRKYKALETFGRIWATIDLSDDSLVELIKIRCRVWFVRFDITEAEVESVAKYFK